MQPRHSFLTKLSQGLMRLNADGQGMLLAVSGGADSMGLLHGVLNSAADSTGLRIEVAHLNHALRGPESDADAELVRETCERAAIPLTTETLSAGTLKSSPNGSIENAARTARYEFLQRTALAKALPLIVTAHHQQDQTETILFSLLRGTGLRGLRGIPETRTLASGIQLIRPMLNIEQTVVRDYVTTNRVAFRDDSSNASPDFARNRIRMLLHSLTATNSNENADRNVLESSLLTLGNQAAKTMATIDRLSKKILSETLLEQSPLILKFDRPGLKTWPEPMIRHALILQWSNQQWPRQQMNSAQWQRLSDGIFSGVPRRWTFPGEIRMTVSRHLVTFQK
jgi:tRNA(Ile)-lysidine synthase